MSFQSLITAAIASGVLAGSSHAITIFGLGAGGQLYSFDSAAPGSVSPVGSPLGGGIVDIDYRGSNNVLYGISGSGSTYSVDTVAGTSSLLFNPSASLGGTVTGFDFNPMADRMRIVVGGVNNFRMVPDNIAGMTAGTVVNGTAGDGQFGVPMSVTILDVAYTNPFNGPAGTAFYSVGSNGILYTHTVAPQFNTMTQVGSGFGFIPVADSAFDIGQDGNGYLVSGNSFYTVNLGLGTATLVGTLGQSLTSISAVPEPSAAMLGGLAGLGLLRRRRAA